MGDRYGAAIKIVCDKKTKGHLFKKLNILDERGTPTECHKTTIVIYREGQLFVINTRLTSLALYDLWIKYLLEIDPDACVPGQLTVDESKYLMKSLTMHLVATAEFEMTCALSGPATYTGGDYLKTEILCALPTG